ncbi:cysteine-rich venom protein 6-like [Anopheles arabiensis]|uniref:cysteine-rich venom protein 6-like n=1 Tax=Anopheles arabiensis TaxID=7173 RepID=UPI001AADE8E1|nr:cysteine-rich venom protein 6-like [Anopheles arabiensis]
MKSVQAFLLLTLLAVAVTGDDDLDTKCGENEVWDDCASSCQDICFEPPAEHCDKKCNIGCFCEKGYVREYLDGGKCVRPDTYFRINCICGEEYDREYKDDEKCILPEHCIFTFRSEIGNLLA